MFQRLVNPTTSNSFFLFGARGTGKTTFLRKTFASQIGGENNLIALDLLDPELENRLSLHPLLLKEIILGKRRSRQTEDTHTTPPLWVLIDEVQKVPALLDVVHSLIEEHPNLRFILTGSSSRKLKRGHANLLAGRAFMYSLFPLTTRELGNEFHLHAVLEWGSLPKIPFFESPEDKKLYLSAYTQTYLKEEIFAEQIVRNLTPFRRFLEVAAQAHGEVLNFSKIARDCQIDPKTCQNHFQILEDTLIGFFLFPHHTSFRKQQSQAPKFYFFDLGVKRALDHTLGSPLNERSYGYGKAFETWVIQEMYRLNEYLKKDYQLGFLRTKDGFEIDLILKSTQKGTIFIEIKSSASIDAKDLSSFISFAKEFPEHQYLCLSRDSYSRKVGNVSILPWQDGIKHLFDL